MTDPEDWEPVARDTVHWALMCLLDDAAATVEPVADTVYWDHEVSAEQVERMRQLTFEFQYVTETHLARLCETTDPWTDDEERTPTHLPAPGRDVKSGDDETVAENGL